MRSSRVATALVNVLVVPVGSAHALSNATFSVIEFSTRV
jgi:hypothetical protein